MPDFINEKCGVLGVYMPEGPVAHTTYTGLSALQHRGQESAGIATWDGTKIRARQGMGLVAQIFDDDDLAWLHGNLAIGHTRYSTTGSSIGSNAQPIVLEATGGELALAHNGNLANAKTLREDLEAIGARFQTETDSEAIAWLLAHTPGENIEDKFRQVMMKLNGSYSLTFLTPGSLWAVRDPMGNRPLCLGKLEDGWIVASESYAFKRLKAQYIRDIDPGEVLRINETGLESFFPLGKSKKEAFCSFERIYFAHPASRLGGETVLTTRRRMGQQLAIEHPTLGADIVIGVPDSANPAAIGYAREHKLFYDEGFVRDRYVGRTFINPDQTKRSEVVDIKLAAVPEVLDGMSVVVVDDSIVRGNTTPRVVEKLREAGAREVHLRITSPPITDPCYYGVDMATRAELIASRLSVEEIRQFTGADSLGFLSEAGLLVALRSTRDQVCLACFNGQYPTSVQSELMLAITS